MRRLVPLLVLVVVAAVLAFSGLLTSGDEDAAGLRPERVAHVEELIRADDTEGARRALTSAQGMNPAEVAYGEAIVAFAAGDVELALERARASRQTAPLAWRPLSIEYAALLQLGREADAARLVAAALEAAPDDERVLAMAAHHFADSERDRDPHRARELLARIDALPERKAPEGDPTAVQEDALLRVRYATAMATGAYESARAAAAQLVISTGGHPATFVLAGEAARRAGDLGEALEKYRRAVQLAPTQRAWQEHLVQLLLDSQSGTQEALERTSAMLRTWPSERSVRVLRARVLVRAEKLVPDGPDRAVTIYRQLLDENPDDLDVLRNLALVLYDWKQGGADGAYLDEAHALLRRYVLRGGAIDDQLGSTWSTLQQRAAERAAARDPETMPERAAFEAAPGDATAAEAYMSALLDAGRADEAGAVVRRALETAPDDAGVNALAARYFMTDGPDHDAVTALHHLDVLTSQLGGDEQLSESLVWLRCRALLLARRHTEALEDARRLVAARPTAVPYLETAARIALALERMADAEAWLREALVQGDRADLRALLEQALGERAE